jgi:hypothetical protein
MRAEGEAGEGFENKKPVCFFKLGMKTKGWLKELTFLVF